MNHLFQVTVYTGQQLVLEALQRWLQRPCAEPESQRQRRTSIKGLVVLLLKTAATGVLATVLDAAIEYRRRQLLVAAEQDPSDTETRPGSSRFPSLGLGPLSRAGIAAWKARLLLAIDEMERHAEQYGIEPIRRFAKPEDIATCPPIGKSSLLGNEDYRDTSLDEAHQVALAATVEQLQQLAKLGSDEAQATLHERVDSLLDTILADIAPSRPGCTSEIRAPSSSEALTVSEGGAIEGSPDCNSPTASSSCGGGGGDVALDGPMVCNICMDKPVGVQVMGCHHDLCFSCARRLCAAHDHVVPHCPFCRRTIDGWTLAPTTQSI